MRSGFGYTIHFTPEISYPTITYLCLLSDPPHVNSEIYSCRRKKAPNATKPIRENRGVLFPIISDFQKGENVGYLGHFILKFRMQSLTQSFFEIQLMYFYIFPSSPERSEISSEQFLLRAHLINSVHSFSSSRNTKYVSVMTAHRRQ